MFRLVVTMRNDVWQKWRKQLEASRSLCEEKAESTGETIDRLWWSCAHVHNQKQIHLFFLEPWRSRPSKSQFLQTFPCKVIYGYTFPAEMSTTVVLFSKQYFTLWARSSTYIIVELCISLFPHLVFSATIRTRYSTYIIIKLREPLRLFPILYIFVVLYILK